MAAAAAAMVGAIILFFGDGARCDGDGVLWYYWVFVCGVVVDRSTYLIIPFSNRFGLKAE